MNKNHFYTIRDSYFETFNDPYLKGNKEDNRPYYYGIEDKEGIYWMIPLSSKVEKYESIIQRKVTEHKPCDVLHIDVVAGKKSVFVIQDMFPITEEYIERYYTINNEPLKLVKEKQIKRIEKKAKKVLVLIKQGRKLLKTSPNVRRIYEQLLEIKRIEERGGDL